MAYHKLVGVRPRDPVYLSRMAVFRPSTEKEFLLMWECERKKAKPVRFRVPHTLWKAVSVRAEAQGVSICQLVRREAYRYVFKLQYEGAFTWGNREIFGMFSANSMRVGKHGGDHDPMVNHVVYMSDHIVEILLKGRPRRGHLAELMRLLLIETVVSNG